MKKTVQFAVAAMTLGFFATAHASTIEIQTGNSTAGSQLSAAAYETTVDAAITGGTSASVSSYDDLVVGYSNYAFKSTVNFGVSAANAGTWAIRSGVDFGHGGAIFVDGVAQDFKTNDMWWAGNYENASQNFTISLNLSAGNHTLNIYGLEGCCHGDQQAQFKTAASGANFTSFSSTDGLISAVPEPDTYAMLLGGLGLVGFMARRRSAQSKKA